MGVLVVVAVAIAVVLATTATGEVTADGGPSPSASSSSRPSAEPSESATTSPDESPVPAPGVSDPETDVPGGTVVDVVPTTGTADFGDQVSARVVSIDSTTAEGNVAGEVSGPAVRVEIELINGTASSIDLGSVTVTLDYPPDRTPAPPFESMTEPFAGSLDSGDEQRAVYVFAVPEEDQAGIVLSMSYAAERPYVVFRG